MNHSVIVNPRLPSVSTVTVPEGQVPRAILLQRSASELSSLGGITYRGKMVSYHTIVEGDTTKHVFENSLEAGGVLSITWQAKIHRPRHISYELETSRKVDVSPLATSIAESMRCEPERFQTFLGKIANHYGVSADSILEFFGEDGFSTVDPEMIANLERKAEELKKPAGDIIAIGVLSGVARTVSERQEFDDLRKNGSDETKPDDFIVEAKTVSESPQAMIPANTGESRPTVGDLITLASALDVDTEWAKSAIRIISDLHKVKPDEMLKRALQELRLLSTFNGQGLDNFQRGSIFLSKIAQDL